MHSNTALLILVLSVFAPALSAPIPDPASSNEVRTVDFAALATELAKGVASGGSLAEILTEIERLTGKGSSTESTIPAQKRELEDRAVDIADAAELTEELAKGLASRGARAGAIAGFEKLVGSKSTPARRRGLLDKILPAATPESRTITPPLLPPRPPLKNRIPISTDMLLTTVENSAQNLVTHGSNALRPEVDSSIASSSSYSSKRNLNDLD